MSAAPDRSRAGAAPVRVLSPFLFTLRTKGAAGLAGRLATVSTRFGPTPRTMATRLEHVLACAEAAGFRPSCPVTARVLARHPQVIRSLAGRGMEFPIHGLRHNDHTMQDAATQAREVAEALRVFERCGIHPTGFRAPYLRADEGTAAAVRAAGLTYQSDDAVAFPVGRVSAGAADDDGYRRALVMYDAQDAATVAARPTVVDGLVRIPVCVPDDEMLVDRLHLPDRACGEVWSTILEKTHACGDLFTMQVHPERFVHSQGAVTGVLLRAARLPGGVWCARLDEIAEWWLARRACRVSVDTSAAEVTVEVQGDPRARIRLVGGRRPDDGSRAAGRRIAVGRAQRFPAVRLDADVSPAVRRFLEEDGFLVVTHGPADCAVHLHADTDAADQIALRRRVLDAEDPVVAVDRWPGDRRSALALTGDIDALTVQDFVHRVRENAYGVPVGTP